MQKHAPHSGGHVVQLGQDPQGHEDMVEKKTSSGQAQRQGHEVALHEGPGGLGGQGPG